MKYLRCSFMDLMDLPEAYVEIVVKEAQREAKEARAAANKSKSRR